MSQLGALKLLLLAWKIDVGIYNADNMKSDAVFDNYINTMNHRAATR